MQSSFAEAEKRSDDEKAAGNTLCIYKAFEDVWAFFCPSKPCLSLSIEGIISSVLRGLGDSKSPMYFIAAACVTNIVLDYVFMGALGLGPVGAALGTTLSQAVSGGIALLYLRRTGGVALTRASFRPRRDVMGRLLSIGVPIALQDGFIQIAFKVVNRRALMPRLARGIISIR